MANLQRPNRFGTSILFMSMLALLIFITRYQPAVAAWLPPVIMMLGGGIFTLACIGYGRYYRVFDYEPATLLGRTTNGKRVRSLFKTLGFVGGWFIILGGSLLMFT